LLSILQRKKEENSLMTVKKNIILKPPSGVGLLSSLFLKSLSCGEGFRVRFINAEIVNISSFLTSPPAPLRLERGVFFENLTALPIGGCGAIH
jgi:hypothetical protein